LGCSIAVDDFGAGRASVIQLSFLAVDIVKIDGNFIRGASRSDQGYATFLRLMQLGMSLAPTVIVEGVETAHQANLACEAGANWLQGYQFGRPSASRPLPMTDDLRVVPSIESIAPPSSASKRNSGAVGARAFG
jgi:EAL domain-containing protein (putative c-di-GMP-specific phosphodiesterase class I)